ncbi:hypothetical protein [Pedobacter sp. SL55]|uniref:hypothetical protein n=1 Tax=Pedobacter sp. SL55 TaxID=2995161 RepID=UPI00226E2183|nr:hypothetical protein [Pedobacter sp. SL55]WAC42515.1 hypothetical protein OVA16_09235 [Pedobacter sp. SL55]
MKKILLSFGLCVMLAIGVQTVSAQVKIGDNPTTVNKASILELEHSSKGLLFPRVNLTNTTSWGLAAGSTPVAGMVVYNTKTVATGFSGTVAYPALLPDGTGLYYWDGNGWVAAKGMKGDAGVVGVQGMPGTTGTPGTPGTPGGPAAGITIVTNDTGTWVYNPTTNTWTNINGSAGAAGATGAAGPQGATGANGADGKSVTGGAGTPGATGATGTNGDTYIDVTNGDVYTYNGTTWNVTGNIKGATGAAGPQGATGANGADGKSVTGGAGTPGATGATGTSGDSYIDVTNGDVYTYNGTTWNVTGNIKGATGVAGATGATGTFVATVDNGLNFSTPTNIQLGGVLTQPITTITTNTTAGSNTLAIAGLQASNNTTDKIVVADATTGVLRVKDANASKVVKINTAYSALADDATILADATSAPFTLTIPTAASSAGRIITIRKVDVTSNLLTFSQTIKLNEVDTFTGVNYSTTIRIQSDGTDWYMID